MVYSVKLQNEEWEVVASTPSETNMNLIIIFLKFFFLGVYHLRVILKKSLKLTVWKYWNKKLFLLKYFAGDH